MNTISCRSKTILLATLGFTAVWVSNLTFGHEGAKGIIKERMDSMKAMQDHAKPMRDMFKGKTEFDLEKLKAAASAFIEHGEKIPSHYPDTIESRQGAMTEALPEIWDDWNAFVKSADRLVESSTALLTAIDSATISTSVGADTQETLSNHFREISKNCFNCHKKFRKDDS